MSGSTLTAEQQRDIERARELVTVHGAAEVAAYLQAKGHTIGDPGDPYPEAYGRATVIIQDLLDIIGQLTGGQS